MKIAILSRSPRCYSTQRLRQACTDRGHTVRVLDTLHFSISVDRGRPELFYRDKRLSRYDAVVPRIGASITFYGTAVVRQFEQMGVFCLSSSGAITVSRDKLRSLQLLSTHDIGIPPTTFVRNTGSILPTIARTGGAPVILKLLEGTQGRGVILADSLKVAQAIIETLQSARQNVLIQKFVKESRGRDIRAFVVGGRVVAAIRRIAQGEEFRSNVHRGGIAEKVDLSPSFERTAIRAAQVMGLRVAGVDLLEAEGGPLVIEVNSSPGLEGIETATGIDVAGAVIDHVEDQVLFPDVDIKQRLTLDQGVGIAEFSINSKSPLRNRTIRECGLRQRDVQVLSLRRGGDTVPNPRSDTVLQVGDVILCFGRLLTLKELIPKDRRGRRKRTLTRA